MEIPAGQVMAMVLGVMQDAGLPQAGCLCSRCIDAFKERREREFTTSLAIIDTRRIPFGVWLIDASPDIKDQLNLLAKYLGPRVDAPERLRQPDGLFLTHAHMGHTAGLVHLGPEAMNVESMPIYAPDGLVKVLLDTRLWQPLLDRIELNSLTSRHSLVLSLPDLDDWDQWPQADETIMGVDIALVDASFYSRTELGGRDPVAHPLIRDTLGRFSNFPGQLVLTHLNHTNPALDTSSEARKYIEVHGAQVAHTGQLFDL